MQYLGGKFRLSSRIVPILEALRAPGQAYLEPFSGAGHVLEKMRGTRIGSDVHVPLITLLTAVRDGWQPPKEVGRDLYHCHKALREPGDPLTAFCGFGLSFAGKYFAGYTGKNPKIGTDPCNAARNALLRQAPLLKGAQLLACDYRAWGNVRGFLIYCDPPYAATTGYSTGKFDSEAFWEQCRRWSRYNTVVVSEYSAPKDFQLLAAFEHVSRVAIGKTRPTIDKLFTRKNLEVAGGLAGPC